MFETDLDNMWYVLIDGVHPVTGMILPLTETQAMEKRRHYRVVADSGTTLFVTQLSGPFNHEEAQTKLREAINDLAKAR